VHPSCQTLGVTRGDNIESIAFFAVVVFVAWLAVFNVRLYFRTRDNPEALRVRLDLQFRDLSLPSADRRYAFDGRTAEVVKEDEEIKMVNLAIVAIKVRRITRNQAGEYFLFVSDGKARPYVKYIPHSNAKVLLGEAYVAPSSDA
jgi:hypothetical protein